MRILNFDTSKSVQSYGDGLKDPIVMERINRIVLLTGKNGSGKSRLLKRLAPFGIANAAGDENPSDHGIDFGELAEGSHPVVHPFSCSPTHEEVDFNRQNKVQIDKLARSTSSWCDDLGVTATGNPAAWIHRVFEQHVRVTHSLSKNVDPDIVKMATDNYQKTNDLLKKFCGTSIEQNLHGEPTLFDGMPLYNLSLSPGQSVLLNFCFELYGRTDSGREVILTLDEPEVHLHSTALKSIIDSLLDVKTIVQLWIATHSVPLIADLACQHFDNISLFLLDNGTVKFASNMPDKILESIVGSAESRLSLRKFTDFPAEYARTRFICECLCDPKVFGFDESKNDPQVELVKSAIQDAEPIPKLLEIGIGSGRVLADLNHRFEDIASRVDYFGVDSSDSNRSECQRVFEQSFGSHDGRLIEQNEIESEVPDNSLDFVLMCSVLHEIEPTKWIDDLFGKTGSVTRKLASCGTLIVVEDYNLPHGEKAHHYDFLVLDRQAICKLFDADENEIETRRSGDDLYAHRIKAHFIPQHCLERANNESRLAALTSLRDSSLEAVRQLRESRDELSQFKRGGRLAFFEHQYVSAILAISDQQ